MSKWINFQIQLKSETRKTDIYHIYANEGGYLLGVIKWHGAWRKYAYWPEKETLFETTCMMDIVIFMQELMNNRKEK